MTTANLTLTWHSDALINWCINSVRGGFVGFEDLHVGFEEHQISTDWRPEENRSRKTFETGLSGPNDASIKVIDWTGKTVWTKGGERVDTGGHASNARPGGRGRRDPQWCYVRLIPDPSKTRCRNAFLQNLLDSELFENFNSTKLKFSEYCWIHSSGFRLKTFESFFLIIWIRVNQIEWTT